jgi:hypothetical protein
MIRARPLLLKIRWTRLLEYECDTVSSLWDFALGRLVATQR